MATRTITTTFTETGCQPCGAGFFLPDWLERQCRDGDRGFWCPACGASLQYTENEKTKLRAQLDQAEADAAAKARQIAVARQQRDEARAEAAHQEAVARGYKGAMVKARQRSAEGVCPVAGCKRHFVDVQRHVASKHPDYHGGEG